jgi:hypothetical protein
MFPERYDAAMGKLADAFEHMIEQAKTGDEAALTACLKIGEAWVHVLGKAVAASNETPKPDTEGTPCPPPTPEPKEPE